MLRRAQAFPKLANRYGWMQAVKVALLWVGRQMIGYRSATVYCLDLNQLSIPSACNRLDWSCVSPMQVNEKLLAVAGLSRDELKSSSNFCFVGALNSVQCYFSVFSLEGFSIPDRISVRFAGTSDVYVGNCLTLDTYRGMGIYPRALLALANKLKEEGRLRLYIYTEDDNLASIRPVLKAGFVPVMRCSVYHVSGAATRTCRILNQAYGLKPSMYE